MPIINDTNRIAILLYTSFLLLSSLIPGGPIETRSFSHIDSEVLLAFNTFLTLVALGSAITAVLVWKRLQYSYILSAFFAISYFTVYALDLTTVFPVSPDSMPTSLLTIEVIGLAVSITLFLLSIKEIMQKKESSLKPEINRKALAVTGLILIPIGTFIIIFATFSAKF
ncbi:hypothetical protein [Thiomicrorhabdus indica]|uniref:hypothetical protein n=1 Tax=Thiomicrorhabdus indica TaxID=2267253 RepID=UPI002AA74868|nr:hypothetical protein [Thiomicrorhabdus indica]